MENEIIVDSGILDGTGADAIVESMSKEGHYTLDFDKVEGIRFAALRSLLRARQNGFHFTIINLCQSVAEMFDETGVSVFISTCRKPKHLDISKYSEFGGGFMSKAFNCDDGDSMMKLYGSRVPKRMVEQEKLIARSVMVFGIPTPLVGSLYEDGENNGLDFERIEGKRSFSRIISEEPERMEELTVKFAKMCKKLHATQCNVDIFPDRTISYKRAVDNCKELSDEEKAKVQKFLASVPPATTCLHGDMQLSNVITNGKDDLWIDLADFSYGNPMLDLGMWYFLSMLNSEEISQHVFHLGVADMSKIWKIFAREYFDADTQEKYEEVVRKVEPFAALHMIYLGSTYGWEPHMMPFVKKTLLK